MMQRIQVGGLSIAECLFTFVNQTVLPNTEIDEGSFWRGVERIINDLTPVNRALLNKRAQLQAKINEFHQQHNTYNLEVYRRFLTDIGYLVLEPEEFSVLTNNVDDEVARLAGPQLVVPINNARYALNAANARWGSLYDALYGTDVIDEENGGEKSSTYNPVRGSRVIAYARAFLEQVLPLQSGSHHHVSQYQIVDGQLVIQLDNCEPTRLQNPAQWLGYRGPITNPDALIFEHHGLHFELQFDATSEVAESDTAGVSDILLESALTSIMDCEDSVAAVDAEDKTLVYQNWFGLISGQLTEEIDKGNKTIVRQLNTDRHFVDVLGNEQTLKGRCLMFVRNVGHLMTNNAIVDVEGNEVFEGILDAIITSLIGKHDLLKTGELRNSRFGSIYIVKPKMHGPEEVKFTNELFGRVEELLKLPNNTIKLGIMDEERRTTLNLKACIAEAKERVVFINTGFLDRTGDEIHTSMFAGTMVRKAEMKATPWIAAYEDNNVDTGLLCGLSGKAQIGKGMWAMPDKMAEMMTAKIAHPKSGANTAWVPSPTAATLHVMHYHYIDVFEEQRKIVSRAPINSDDLLTLPIDNSKHYTDLEITNELDNNAQGILGYMVRWVEQGVGCSKVPDINHVGLMEDRATLRISSQHMTNWLLHGVCSKDEIIASLKRMAKVVDQQNANDPEYKSMAPDYDNSIAFNAAVELVLEGVSQPSGYTEPVLHKYRLLYKQKYL